MLGVVNLDKPVGPTSHDMVALLRRLTGTRRIGHAGTLDPLASGVLPVLVGPATRFSEELTGGAKRYDAVIRLGATSATDDSQGPITPVAAPMPTETAIREAVRGMTGRVSQRPPAFSARKVGGQTAHRAARAGQPLELESREVEIEALDVRSITSGDGWVDVDVEVRCGAGTYVRSIARDLGEHLGVGGYLRTLRRTEAAGLHVDDAFPPDRLEALAAHGRLGEAISPVGDLILLPAVHLAADQAQRFVHGVQLAVQDRAAPRVKVYDDAGRLLGLGSVEDGWLDEARVLLPVKVLPPHSSP